MEAISISREQFKEKGMYKNEVYGDVPELLEQLKTAGYQLAVATTKPSPQ